jgi:isocitrate/isopropylmalate dehydrogenase
MLNLSIVVHDAEEGVRVSTETELDRVIHIACEEARARNMLNIVFLEAVNGNVLSLVVGVVKDPKRTYASEANLEE